jgi:hypothetical protein
MSHFVDSSNNLCVSFGRQRVGRRTAEVVVVLGAWFYGYLADRDGNCLALWGAESIYPDWVTAIETIGEEEPMSVVITRIPSTGEVVNMTESFRPTDELARDWAGWEAVEVMSYEKYRALPQCGTCGNWTALRRCIDCR